MNCFSGQSIKCGHCSDIERTSRGHDTATQYPEPSSPFSFGGISSAKDEYSKKKYVSYVARRNQFIILLAAQMSVMTAAMMRKVNFKMRKTTMSVLMNPIVVRMIVQKKMRRISQMNNKFVSTMIILQAVTMNSMKNMQRLMAQIMMKPSPSQNLMQANLTMKKTMKPMMKNMKVTTDASLETKKYLFMVKLESVQVMTMKETAWLLLHFCSEKVKTLQSLLSPHRQNLFHYLALTFLTHPASNDNHIIH